MLLAAASCSHNPAFATVNTTTSSTNVVGTGAQTAFAFNFIGVAAPYISVLYTDASGNQTLLTQGSASNQYQVAINAAVPGATWGIGGTVTYNPLGTPIPAGATLTIYRNLPLLQAISLSNQGNLASLASASERAIDTVDMQAQQIFGVIGRAIVANAANSAAPLPLPPAPQSANKGLCFDGTGLNLVACALPSSGAISTAMQPVVNAASLALGRTAFGLGATAVENIGSCLADDGAGSLRVTASVVTDATSVSVAAADACRMRAVNANGIVYTLPLGSTLWNGFSFKVNAVTGPAVLAPNAADQFPGISSGVALTAPQGYTATLTTNAASPSAVWYVSFSANDAAVPSGAVMMFAGPSSCPRGFVANNGQALSRTVFSGLFTAIGTTYGVGDGTTTFNVPNDQGYFWRSVNTGAGVDASRVLGSTENDAIGPHTHSLTSQALSVTANSSVNAYQGVGTSSTGQPNSGHTAAETRPYNIAYLSCIKI